MFLGAIFVLGVLFVAGLAFRNGLPVQIRYEREPVRVIPLQLAIMDDASLDDIKRLVQQDPIAIQRVDPVFGTAMDQALVNDRVDLVAFLLESGYDPDHPMTALNERPCNPLGYAIRFGKTQIAKLLVQHSADPTIASWDGIPAKELCLEFNEGKQQSELLELLQQ